MTTSPANVSGNPAAAALEQSTVRRGPPAPRQRTTFSDWLGSQLEAEPAAVPASSRAGRSVARLAPSTTDTEILPARGSFRARGNTPQTLLDDGSAPGFERSSSRIAPHLIRYTGVPDSAKFPAGPYYQAPAEAGGEWWLVNPFTGAEPWLRLERALTPPEEEVLPEGFADVFGPRPTRKLLDYFEFRLAKMEWEHDLKFFKQAGIPEGLDETQLEAAKEAFAEWGLGEPVFYEGRYGWRVRFPESDVPGFEMNPNTAVQAPHVVIAKYQIRLIRQGTIPENLHPWVPPHQLTPGVEA